MRWIKKGLIFEAGYHSSLLMSHAALPFVDFYDKNIYRIYFTSRDDQTHSHVHYIEIELNELCAIRTCSQEPILSPGALGGFDDSGAMGSWMIRENNRCFLFYTGWSLGITVPFYFSIGLAISNDGEHFSKISRGPLFDRNEYDPFLSASPCVIKDRKVWKMWYVSGLKWVIEKGKPKHFYHIKYAESFDGIAWKRDGIVAIDFKSEDEYAIARPCVIKDGDIYKMWYCYRGDSYRIGYAESTDGISWVRKDDEAGIDVSESGWDSQMIAYPFVFDHKGKRYMLYNGNEYGKTGFGLAILE